MAHAQNKSKKSWRRKNHPQGWRRAVWKKKLERLRKKDPNNPAIKVLEEKLE